MNLDEVELDYDYGQYLYGSGSTKRDRMNALKGKYVVSCTGKSSGRVVFQQDQSVSRGGHWTQFLSNAIGYRTLEEAEAECRKFKYGNPRVARVEQNGNFNFKFRTPPLKINSSHKIVVTDRIGDVMLVNIRNKYGDLVKKIEISIDYLKALEVIKSARGTTKAEAWMNTDNGRSYINILLGDMK